MSVKLRKIEVDPETADLLEARATARGMSVAEFLADLACNGEALPADLAELRAKGEGPWSLHLWMLKWAAATGRFKSQRGLARTNSAAAPYGMFETLLSMLEVGSTTAPCLCPAASG